MGSSCTTAGNPNPIYALSPVLTVAAASTNAAPSFGADSYSAFNLAENADGSVDANTDNMPDGVAVGTVTATDADAGDAVAYSITAGNTSGKFAIDSSSGALSYIGAGEDFESFATPASAYTLTVQASDGTDTDTATVTVAVTDVNEFTGFPAATASHSVAENTTAVTTLTAADEDAGDTVSYALTGTDADLFEVAAATGALSFKAAPDFESPALRHGQRLEHLHAHGDRDRRRGRPRHVLGGGHHGDGHGRGRAGAPGRADGERGPGLDHEPGGELDRAGWPGYRLQPAIQAEHSGQLHRRAAGRHRHDGDPHRPRRRGWFTTCGCGRPMPRGRGSRRSQSGKERRPPARRGWCSAPASLTVTEDASANDVHRAAGDAADRRRDRHDHQRQHRRDAGHRYRAP